MGKCDSSIVNEMLEMYYQGQYPDFGDDKIIIIKMILGLKSYHDKARVLKEIEELYG